jgi:peptidyl-Lys metalloendopeptidase
VRIEAGATLSYTVELTATYDLARNGTYAIEYSGKGALRSDVMYLWLEARSSRGAVTTPATAAGSGPQPAAASITFTGNCSASRQTALIQAVADATTYADGAVNYFASTRWATARYTKWFGVADRIGWNTARTHYIAIQDAFVTKPLTLDCSCTSSAYAYVFPAQAYKIYLCNAFWAAPATGTDSKSGTLIHEMSHFTVVAGTDDWAYGQAAAAALAISDPAKALNNADSHEYFAENTPYQP